MRQYRRSANIWLSVPHIHDIPPVAKKDHEVLSESERSSRDTGIRIALAFAYFTNMSISIPTSA